MPWAQQFEFAIPIDIADGGQNGRSAMVPHVAPEWARWNFPDTWPNFWRPPLFFLPNHVSLHVQEPQPIGRSAIEHLTLPIALEIRHDRSRHKGPFAGEYSLPVPAIGAPIEEG